MKKMILLTLPLLLLTACQVKQSNSKKEELPDKTVEATSSYSTEKSQSASSKTEQTDIASDEALAKEFFTYYINQKIELSDIENRIEQINRLLSEEARKDTSILSYLKLLKIQVEDWEKQGKPEVQYGFSLTNRRLTSIELYHRQDKYLADVSYEESSPGVEGSLKIRKVYIFNIGENKISNLETIGIQ